MLLAIVLVFIFDVRSFCAFPLLTYDLAQGRILRLHLTARVSDVLCLLLSLDVLAHMD